MTIKTKGLLACPECDALQRSPEVPDGAAAECRRCGAELFHCRPRSLDHTLAFLVGAAIVFGFANAFPLMSLDAQGLRTSATLFDTAHELYEYGMASVAFLVLATTILLPAVQLGAMLYMLAPLRLGYLPPGVPLAFRIAHAVRPWVMLDVFILGAMVSLVKLTQVAKVEPGVGIFAVGAYILMISSAIASFEPREFWLRVDELGSRERHLPAGGRGDLLVADAERAP